MLLRFGVANHRSIRERQEISLVASKLKGGTTQPIEVAGLKEQVLPAALVYGANASGKSNLLGALSAMCEHVRDSFHKRAPNAGVPRDPFRLDDVSIDRATEFDIDFIVDGVRYEYGFACNDARFTAEWLYAYPAGSRQVWLERNNDDFRFGRGLKGENKTIASITRSNSLFISTAAQHSHKQVAELYNCLARGIALDLSVEISAAEIDMNAGILDSELVEFLRYADVGIVDVRKDEISPDERAAHEKILENLKAAFAEQGEIKLNVPSHRIRFGHSTNSGTTAYLDLSAESRGTLRLTKLVYFALAALRHGKVVVIDELDASLHTLLASRLIELFGNPKLNPKGAQLLATTHDTHLLCSPAIRRDQIWFAEKNREGATSIYPLTDIRTRAEDNLERGYLQGRFGAIPFLGSVEELFGGTRRGDA